MLQRSHRSPCEPKIEILVNNLLTSGFPDQESTINIAGMLLPKTCKFTSLGETLNSLSGRFSRSLGRNVRDGGSHISNNATPPREFSEMNTMPFRDYCGKLQGKREKGCLALYIPGAGVEARLPIPLISLPPLFFQSRLFFPSNSFGLPLFLFRDVPQRRSESHSRPGVMHFWDTSLHPYPPETDPAILFSSQFQELVSVEEFTGTVRDFGTVMGG